jgi:hypothetical protein
MKLLGVYIAYNMSWNFHVDFVRAKCAKLVGFVSRNLKNCSPKVKLQSYLTLIRPVMSYGAPAWHPTSNENMKKLQLLQNRVSRLIYGYDSTHKLDCKIMSHVNYLKFLDIFYFYKCRNDLVDVRVTDVVTTGRVIRGGGGVNRLIPPKVRTSLYQNGFVCRSTNLWNELPANIKTSSTVTAFKSA